MKKIIALFAVLVICLSFLSSIGQVFAANDADSLTIIDLIRLKKHIIANFDNNANSDNNPEFDYNGDNVANAQDLIVLRRILLGLPYQGDSNVDDGGYNNEVVKP